MRRRTIPFLGLLAAAAAGLYGALTGPAAASLYQTRTIQLAIDVEARCDGGVAVFRVRNKGAKWAGVADLRVLDPHGRTVALTRRRGLETDKVVILRHDRAEGPLELYVTPGWYLPDRFVRRVAPTARVSCG